MRREFRVPFRSRLAQQLGERVDQPVEQLGSARRRGGAGRADHAAGFFAVGLFVALFVLPAGVARGSEVAAEPATLAGTP